MLGVIARTCPPGPNDRRPENGTNDRPKVPVSAPRGTSIACVRACVSRLAEFRASGLAAIIGPRKRQLIVELAVCNSYVVEYFNGVLERFNYFSEHFVPCQRL